ncbi:hypothetical protein [Sandaracinus amylolyticus]|uniref:hypothetical protein n=1 Tax=Sandaracinus amylolyticus TaxID=927083 RepID=UPI001F2D3291|nr:hypothetical protein [Sandaracinus amylolyticus]UJR79137.1 Hypothetical protein I5071_11700 [Sandaracinus amylolyticus]
MRSRDPYRSPAPPPPGKPRGVVVRRADSPDELERRDDERRRARQRAQSARTVIELEEARRRGAIVARAQGAALIAIGLVSCALSMSHLDAGYYHPRSIVVAGGALSAGLWLVVFGAGGATSLRDAPSWVAFGAVLSLLGGAVFGATRLVDLLAWIAG